MSNPLKHFFIYLDPLNKVLAVQLEIGRIKLIEDV